MELRERWWEEKGEVRRTRDGAKREMEGGERRGKKDKRWS